jgi:hypothetical protein
VGADPAVNGPCEADATTQIMVLKIRPIPAYTNVPPSLTTNLLFTLSADSFAPSGVIWSLTPVLSNGANIVWVDAVSALVVPGLISTTYQVRATSVDNPSCFGDAQLHVFCCEPGTSTDVTLTQGSFPWDQPSYAWSSSALANIRDIETVLDDDIVQYMIDNVLNQFGELKPEDVAAKVFLAKLFYDKCCLDCLAPECWQIGKYRYRSLRPYVTGGINPTAWDAGGSLIPAQIVVLWNGVKPFVNAYDTTWGTNYAVQIQNVIDTVSFGVSINIPLNLSVTTQWTHETDECRKCPGACPEDVAVVVPSCYTGFMRAGLNGVVFTVTASSGSTEMGLKVEGVLDWRWHGSRIGLINRKEQWGYRKAWIWTKVPFGPWQRHPPFIDNTWGRTVKDKTLCM